MNLAAAKRRYAFLAEAMEGAGGFAPTVTYQPIGGIDKPASVWGKCHLVPYPRESAEKFAARDACAVYENHLLKVVGRFVSYLSRKRPVRTDADSPLVTLLLNDADDCGNALDVFWHKFTTQAKARGSMLLLIDMPAGQDGVQTMADVLSGPVRAVPYLAAIEPERVVDYALTERGLFASIGISDTIELNGKAVDVVRRWTAQSWEVWKGEELLFSGEHPFGQCPVLAFTENGMQFPQVGKYSQVADLSLRLFNANSELDEILRSQTFSLLTLQLPESGGSQAEIEAATATIGTHSLLTHKGDTPAFIAPDSGPAQIYLARIDAMQKTISKIAMDSATDGSGGVESGEARRMRFEALNADLASFAALMQDLEQRMWALFLRAMGLEQEIGVQWPSDFNLADITAQLDTLALMQSTGFPEPVLTQQRRSIAIAHFDGAPPEVLADIQAALDEAAQSNTVAAPNASQEPLPTQPAPQPPPVIQQEAVDLSPVMGQMQSVANEIAALSTRLADTESANARLHAEIKSEISAAKPEAPPAIDLQPIASAVAANAQRQDMLQRDLEKLRHFGNGAG